MRYIAMLILIPTLAATADQDQHGSLEIDTFGLSYHSNRAAHLNGINPGFGASLLLEHKPGCDWILSAGAYKDSYRQVAHYELAGLRWTAGEEEGWHGHISVSAGDFQGSGNHGFIMIPVMGFGYDRVTLNATGFYQKNSPKTTEQPAGSSVVAVFASWTALRF